MSDGTLRVRLATESDLDTLVALEVEPDTARYLGFIGREFHQRAFADDDQEQIVAEIDGRVVGFVVLAGLRTGGGRIELRRIVLSNSYRGAGHGRALFRAAVARAYRDHGAKELWLDVKPDNLRGQKLYESEGLVRTGTIPDPTDPDGELLVMTYLTPPAHPALPVHTS